MVITKDQKKQFKKEFIKIRPELEKQFSELLDIGYRLSKGCIEAQVRIAYLLKAKGE